MQINLSLDEARVLSLVTQYVMRHKDVAEKILERDQKDISLLNGLAGRVRGLYEMEKGGEK